MALLARAVGEKYDSPADLFCVTPIYSMVQNPGEKKNCLQFNEQYTLGATGERSTEFYVPTEPFSGSDGYIDGKKGLVPAPTTAEQLSFLRGDGTWAVPTMTIADRSITGEKLATYAVTTNKIATGAVTSDKIKDKAVTTAAINDKAVTAAKLGNDVNTIAVQQTEPTDPRVKIWIKT